ncbi:MAG: hypothetical protein AABZ00_00750 [Chloroflexota bacterium]
MKIHPSRFEQMTALTDVALGILAGCAAFQVLQILGFKSAVWGWAFGLLAFSALCAALSHSFEMTQKTNERIWMPVNLSLGWTLALFVVGALMDVSGGAIAKSALPSALTVGFLFFIVTILRPGTFMIFIAYEAVAMLFSLGVYAFLFFNGALPGAGWMLAGVFVTIMAAVVQAVGKTGKSIVWYFDNNGVFHLIQMIGIVLLLVGLKMSL